jgi:hypothetical protein
MQIISTEDALPKDRTYVLIHLSDPPWSDGDDTVGLKWTVAKFVRGITMEERANILPPRSTSYQGCDVHGNNLKPYCWREFGPSTHFGQEVDYWCELPLL